ncbi:MAG: CRTAC1 family protein [Planctomycetes bacterium]|nr:CRTAC1 family protein [Planctomycetota bacterium]MCH9724080.1 CRTAC1 family protein [Planctomycetota bacterium]MCH9778136.1 CRTAC1 family protein [Planctomycetota bacterium]MCH9792294.1 CRTAC1 family protein [Planctomycetota bacterium]
MNHFHSNRDSACLWKILSPVVICFSCLTLLLSASFISAEEKQSEVLFQDIRVGSQVEFQHQSPLTLKRHLHLMMGSGVGWIDYDNDGFPDLYCGQGEAWNTVRENNRVDVELDLSNRLYQNRNHGQFQDVTALAGLISVGYSMGIAVGDYNHDGFDDLYVSQFGRNLFYCNNGDGTFSEITQSAHVDNPGYGASCTWADLNGDGLLDLYVVNYLKIDRQNYPICSRKFDGKHVYFICHPRYVPGQYDVIYQNLGNGSFLNVSKKSGLFSETARQGLGVFATDFDHDGDMDIYVANDSVANQLWINDGRGVFTDQALIAGVAFNRSGDREAGMGIAGADYNGDGLLDLFVTNYFGETNTLYRNEGSLFFLDVTDETGLATASRVRLGFGASFLDCNNDGWQDLFVTNGHVHDRLAQLGKNEPYEQEPQLFLNHRGVRFNDVSENAGTFFQEKQVGRGSAVADWNRDGLADLAVSHLNGKLVLLENRLKSSHQSLSLKLIGSISNRSGIGAKIEVTTGAKKLTRFCRGSSGYLSADDRWVLLGLGNYRGLISVKVTWPQGKTEIWSGLRPGDRYTLIEGTSASQDLPQKQK